MSARLIVISIAIAFVGGLLVVVVAAGVPRALDAMSQADQPETTNSTGSSVPPTSPPTSEPPSSSEPTTSAPPEPSTTEPAPPPPPPDNTKYLSEFGDGLAGVSQVGSSTIGGTPYRNSVTIKCLYGDDRKVPVHYQLGGRYRSLTVYPGIDDSIDVPEARGTITVTGISGASSEQLASFTATRDTAPETHVNVKGVRTLEFLCTPNEGHQGQFSVVLGNAVLHR
jgi:hypothetical protein